MPSLELFEEDVDLAAARQADAERGLVVDAVADESRLALGEHLARMLGDVRLDAAAGDRAAQPAALGHGELGADGARSRAPRGDDGRDRDLLALGAPALRFPENVDLGHALIVVDA